MGEVRDRCYRGRRRRHSRRCCGWFDVARNWNGCRCDCGRGRGRPHCRIRRLLGMNHEQHCIDELDSSPPRCSARKAWPRRCPKGWRLPMGRRGRLAVIHQCAGREAEDNGGGERSSDAQIFTGQPLGESHGHWIDDRTYVLVAHLTNSPRACAANRRRRPVQHSGYGGARGSLLDGSVDKRAADSPTGARWHFLTEEAAAPKCLYLVVRYPRPLPRWDGSAG